MPNAARSMIAVITGIVVGSLVNMALVVLSPAVIPPPAGVDTSSAEEMRRGILLFQPRHFVMPFLAHAIGTFTGAGVAYLVAATQKARWAYLVGAFFLAGGIAASVMIPAPAWFIAIDLLGAYLPMAWLATRLGARLPSRKSAIPM